MLVENMSLLFSTMRHIKCLIQYLIKSHLKILNNKPFMLPDSKPLTNRAAQYNQNRERGFEFISSGNTEIIYMQTNFKATPPSSCWARETPEAMWPAAAADQRQSRVFGKGGNRRRWRAPWYNARTKCRRTPRKVTGEISCWHIFSFKYPLGCKCYFIFTEKQIWSNRYFCVITIQIKEWISETTLSRFVHFL